jgi:multiple antibiotic resistance protein
MVGIGELFTLFLVTLGPIKLMGPFAAQTRHLDPAARRGIALRVFVLSVFVLAAGGYIGRELVALWSISRPALLIATGIIFFLVALNLVLEQYEPEQPSLRPLPPEPMAAALQLTFPTVVTPYGVAALIALLAATRDLARHGVIFAIVFAVMLLNLLAMLFAGRLVHGATALGMRLLGAVLGVLQVILAIEIILRALQALGIGGQ